MFEIAKSVATLNDSQPGGAWQHRWPSLTLSTVNRIHDLPGLPFADVVDTDEAEVQANVAVPRYYAEYERRFELPVRRPVTVTVVCERDGRFHVETDDDVGIFARGLINATGTWQASTSSSSAAASRRCTCSTRSRS